LPALVGARRTVHVSRIRVKEIDEYEKVTPRREKKDILHGGELQ
jgi:hypothetical protein